MFIVGKRMRAAAVAAATTVLLAACGGGGGDTPATAVPVTESPRVTISAANASRVSAEAIAAAGVGDIGSSVAGLFGVQAEATARPPAPLVALVDTVRAGLDLPMTAQAQALVGVTVSQRVPCSGGGTVTVSGTIADANRDTAGDRLSFRFAGCFEREQRLDGSYSVALVSVNAAETLYSIDVAIEGLTVTVGSVADRLSGTLRMTLDETVTGRVGIALSSPTLTSDQLVNGAVRTSRSLLGFTYDATLTTATGASSETFAYVGTGNFGALGSVSFQATTVLPLSTPSLTAVRPTAGSVRVTGANGRTILATVIATGLRLEIDHSGDAAVDEVQELTWAQLDALLQG